MRLYGLRTGEPDPALMGTVGTVAGVLLDEDGHLVASHVAVSVADLRDALCERAMAATESEGDRDAALHYVWLDDDRASAPRPCPGCHRCRRDWPDLVDVDAATMPPLSAEPAGRVDVGVTPVGAPRVDLGRATEEAEAPALTVLRSHEPDLGKVAYEAYDDAAAVIDGTGIPWESLFPIVQDAWRTAAAQVYALALADSRLVAEAEWTRRPSLDPDSLGRG